MDNVTPFPTNKAPPRADGAGLTEDEAKLLLQDLLSESGAEIDRMLADHDEVARKRLRMVDGSDATTKHGEADVTAPRHPAGICAR